MTSLVIDSWAWIEYMNGTPAGRKVESAMSSAKDLWTSVLTIAEVVSKYRRKGMDESQALDAIATLSRAGIPDAEDAIEAGRLQARIRKTSPNFGIADAFVLQLARKLGAKVVTGDPDFRGVKDATFID